MSISGLGGSPFAGLRGAFQPPSFASLDSNSDKSITLDELKAGAPGGATAASDKRAEALFKALDTDGNGGVSEDEKSAFDKKLQDRQASIGFLAQQLSGPSNDAVFSATDSNGDGSVSLDELSDDDAAKGASADSLKKLFDLIDANGDGSIDRTESSDFLDSVKAAVADQGSRPPPPPGGQSGGQPSSPPPPDESSSASTDLLSLAKNAYASTSKSADLIKMLQSLLETAA
ncbi:MAG: EF-hand domain-containing protein [Devosia sp.]